MSGVTTQVDRFEDQCVTWKGSQKVHFYSDGRTLCGWFGRDFMITVPNTDNACKTCLRMLEGR